MYYFNMISVEDGYSSSDSSEFPNGWLLNPERNRLIFFEKNKHSPIDNIRIFAYTYCANDLGEPTAIKSSTQMYLQNAWNKWHDLQLEGWTFEKMLT